MQIEELQDIVFSVASLTAIIVPAWVGSAILCFIFRRSWWITGIWTFAAFPAVLFFALLGWLLFTPTGSGSDAGFAGMGTMFALSFCIFEIVAGLLVLCSVPPPSVWLKWPALIAIPAGLLSMALIFWSVRFATVPPTNEAMALALVRNLAPRTDDAIREAFRRRAFVALLRDPQTSAAVLQEASADMKSNSKYWEALAHNPSLPTSVIESKINDRALGPVFATRHGMDPKYLNVLAHSPDIGTRIFVARNLNTPKDTLEIMESDPDRTVAMFAKQNLSGTIGEFGY